MSSRRDRSFRIATLLTLCGAPLALAQVQAQPPRAFVDGGTAGVLDNLAKPVDAPFWSQHGVKLLEVPGIMLTPIDHGALYQRDLDREAAGLGDGVKRVSVERPVDFHWDAGKWYRTPDRAGLIWILDVTSPNAWGVRLHFTDFDLPPGAKMTVYPPASPEDAPSPYEGKGRRGTGQFWARTAFSDTARIEVFVPAAVAQDIDLTKPLFKVDSLHHWYINMLTGTPWPQGATPEELGCHADVSCFPWANEARGVARLFFNGGLCTGQLLNTLAGDGTPYLFTARHCFSDQASADALETYWFYQTSTCNGPAPALPSGINRADDGTLLSVGTTSDYNLTMIEGAIRRDLWWQGWDSGAFGNGNVANNISHPDGSWKRFASGTTFATGVGCSIAGIGPGITGTWSTGTTEPGSSGSALYDVNRRVRGQLSCANGVCAGASARFYFGPFATTYPNISSLLNAGGGDILDFFNVGNTCANAVDRGGVGTTNFTDLVLKSNRERWFKFTVPSGGGLNYTLSFINAWGDTDTQLLSACGGSVLASSTSTTNAESINWTNTSPNPATVFARVYLFNDTRNQFSISGAVTAAPIQGNDNCASAASISDGETLTGSTLGTNTDGASGCGFNTANDVWFTYSQACTGDVTISTAGSSFDTVLSAHSACPGSAANQIVCNDDFAGTLQSSITFSATAFTTYRIRLAGYNGAAGAYAISVSRSRPSNDLCANASPVGEGTTSFNNCGALRDGFADPASCYSSNDFFGADIWYTYTATANGTLAADTFGSTFDTMLAAYAACPTGVGQALACNDDSAGTLQSSIGFPVSAGQTYLVRVGGYFGAAGSGSINLAFTGSGPTCDSTDFNNDGDFPTPLDLEDFINAVAGNICSTCSTDLDFNNDGDFPTPLDVEAFISVLAGGPCL